MREYFDKLLLPPGASSYAYQNDSILHIVNGICLIFFLINMFFMIYYVIRYRWRSDKDTTPRITHNNVLEVVWTVIPSILLVVLFVLGYERYMDMRIAPGNSMDIYVTAQRWSWAYQYPNGTTSSNSYDDSVTTGTIKTDEEKIGGQGLVVPVGRPVRLVMASNDVLHSFYIPAFRTKQDVLPNRKTVLWFQADLPGSYPVYCAEYCGTSHSRMLGMVHVKSEQDFNDWIVNGGLNPDEMTPAEYGKALYVAKACVTCHTLDGTRKNGPSFKGIWNHQAELTNGQSVLVDEEYIRESVLIPGAKVVAGYAPVMPSFKGQLDEKQINAIIEFLKTVK